MELSVLFLLFTVIGITVPHRDIQFTGCSDTEREFLYGLDGEELFHVDFQRRKAILTAPDFADPVSFPESLYDISLGLIENCKSNLATAAKGYNYPEEKRFPPETSVYSKDDVVVGVDNTLICHVTGFFPPPVMIIWTKNNVNVTEKISQSQYWLKNDGTYNVYSTLRFSPGEGDMYSCTVYYKALENKFETKTWEVDVSLPSVGPAVFCGVGLALGLLGVAVGTFFLIKGNNCN